MAGKAGQEGKFFGREGSFGALPPEEEQGLIQAAQSGDSAAMMRLLDQYEPLLRAAAGQRHLLSLREDALAEAYVSFVRAAREYDAGAGVPFGGFAKARVYGDLRTLFRRAARLWEREATVAEDRGEPFWELVPDEGAERELTRLEERAQLMAAMRRLTARERQIIELIFFEERTQREVAERLAVTQQAIAKAKRRALGKLKAWLGDGGPPACPALC